MKCYHVCRFVEPPPQSGYWTMLHLQRNTVYLSFYSLSYFLTRAVTEDKTCRQFSSQGSSGSKVYITLAHRRVLPSFARGAGQTQSRKASTQGTCSMQKVTELVTLAGENGIIEIAVLTCQREEKGAGSFSQAMGPNLWFFLSLAWSREREAQITLEGSYFLTQLRRRKERHPLKRHFVWSIPARWSLSFALDLTPRLSDLFFIFLFKEDPSVAFGKLRNS